MFYVKLFRHITDWRWARLLLRATVIVFAILEVNVFEGLLGIKFEDKWWVLVFDSALVISENHGWRSEQMALVGNFVDKGRWWKASFLEVEGPVFASVWYLFGHREFSMFWIIFWKWNIIKFISKLILKLDFQSIKLAIYNNFFSFIQ